MESFVFMVQVLSRLCKDFSSFFVSRYGGGPAIPRPVIALESGTTNKRQCQVEVYPLEIQVAHTLPTGLVDTASRYKLV